MTQRQDSGLRAAGLTLRYDERVVSEGLDVEIPNGGLTVIVGPNACGKSTLLRALARLMAPSKGTVLLDGTDIATVKSRVLAQRIGLLPQSSIAADGITVAELVARGRYPHQSVWRQWSASDEAAVDEAIDVTALTELAGRQVDELSGGQRQRVWIALALAQQTPLLLLDEPTTFLDIAHQIELMELLTDLHLAGRTLVAVLHDLNQAARYATHLIAMKDGRVIASGDPREVITVELVEECFALSCHIVTDTRSGAPVVIPTGRIRPLRSSPPTIRN